MHQLRRFKADFFRAIANPTRIAILDSLREGERGVSAIAAAVAAEPAAVSQHLAVLRHKGFVTSRKVGTAVLYAIRDVAIFQLLDDAARIFHNHLVTLLGETQYEETP